MQLPIVTPAPTVTVHAEAFRDLLRTDVSFSISRTT